MTQPMQPKAASDQLNKQAAGRETINLLELADYLWKRALLIALFTLLGGTIAFVYTKFFVTPLYSSSVLIYVNNNSNMEISISGSDLSTSRSLVETYIVALESRETLEEIIEEAGVSYTYDQLGEMISASAVNDTEVLKVVVTGEDPQEAADIANTVIEVLPERIKSIVDGSNAVCVDEAIPNQTPVYPNVKKNTAKGALLGMFLSCGLFILLFLMDTEIHSERYLLKAYPNIPLLTVVPDTNASGSGYGYGYGQRPSSQSSADRAASERRTRR